MQNTREKVQSHVKIRFKKKHIKKKTAKNENKT